VLAGRWLAALYEALEGSERPWADAIDLETDERLE